MNRCFEEAENFHSSFITQTEATQIHLNALQQVRHKKKNALNLNDNVFSTKGDTIFTSPSLRRDRHFTWSSDPREGLAACSVKVLPSFLCYFKTLSVDPAPGIEPTTSRSAVKRSTV